MLSIRKRRRREGGASLVELSLVLFILLLLVAGVIDFGRVFNHYIVITNASREGARQASLRPNSTNRILEAVELEMAQSSVDPGALAVDIEPDPDNYPLIFDPNHPDYGYGQPITVTVSYGVPTIIADIANFGYLPLRVRTTMAIQGPEPED